MPMAPAYRIGLQIPAIAKNDFRKKQAALTMPA
jgi:hypothetical protein